MAFHKQLLRKAGPIWRAMLRHRFLAETANGRIAFATFANWIRQDYLFVREAFPFLAVLSSKAPFEWRRDFSESVAALHRELDLFEKMAHEKRISLENLVMSPTCHSYIHFMLATAYSRGFEEGFTVMYAEEKAYLDCWTWVKSNLKTQSPWQPFIDAWSSEPFQQYVGWIETSLDTLAERVSPRLQQSMTEIFLTTGQYEYLFWEMAAKGESWPVEM